MNDNLPPSLLSLFDPPTDMVGSFGWVCGFSATESFMEEAVHRFSMAGKKSRASDGHILLALILDPSNRPIVRVPGVTHLPSNIDQNDRKRARLTHAKVAILLFQNRIGGDKRTVRLIVSTGNWTGQTVEDSIDLFWSFDLEIGIENNDQKCSDLTAAWGMFGWLFQGYDLRILKRPGRFPELREDVELTNLLASIARKKPQARFIDNRSTNLLSVIQKTLGTNECKRSARLVMGSGFFEGSDSEHIPKVPQKIIQMLGKNSLVDKKTQIALVVNPMQCQAVANAQNAILQEGWKIYEGRVPTNFGSNARSLHAKFIFAGSAPTATGKCLHNWIYFGSGNLTAPGFLNKTGPHGNLEAGVVLINEKLEWTGNNPNLQISRRLPFEWSDEEKQLPNLTPGDTSPDFEAQFTAPPIPYLLWQPATSTGDAQLKYPDVDTSFDVELITLAPNVGTKSLHGWFWKGEQPSYVKIKAKGFLHEIPVVDQCGRIATGKLPPVSLDEAIARLESFPVLAPDENDIDDDGFEIREDDNSSSGINRKSMQLNGAIRPMVQALERIAVIQCNVNKIQWPLWCQRLEAVLTDVADSRFVIDFALLKTGLNPLDILSEKSFRPIFAEQDDSVEGSKYLEMIERVRPAWANKRTFTGDRK